MPVRFRDRHARAGTVSSSSKDLTGYDVFIAGSGPIGATFAKKFIEAGHKVIMVEMGSADSFSTASQDETTNSVRVPGAHKKNEIIYQKNIDLFVNVIQGALNTVSVPTSNTAVPTLDPASFQNTEAKPFVSLGKNPKQSAFDNLGAEAVTHCVGGMSTHWTCATPEFHPKLERPTLDKDSKKNDALWKRLYEEARNVIGTSTKEFDYSIRHTLVLNTLKEAYQNQNRVFNPLPLACHRMPNPDYVEWHAADRILKDIFKDPKKKDRFTLLTNHLCVRLIYDTNSTSVPVKIKAAEVEDLLDVRGGDSAQGATFYIQAKVYIVASGAVSTPQILFNSQFKKTNGADLIPNLGKYITEQPMSFCQVMLKRNLINDVRKNPYHLDWWATKVKEHTDRYPEDPIPIPFRDPEPQVTTPLTEEHPWHTQIHRDAFSYGAVAETIDTRLIVDLRFFGYVEPRAENRIVFEKDIDDEYGLPQPTFHFQMSDSDSDRAHRMMADMCAVATQLGGYLPGSEPQFMTPGLALHLGGTVRADLEPTYSVADVNSKVWDFDNLYVGGNGVIPTGFGANPTLTSICYAIKCSEGIINKLRKPPLEDGTYHITNDWSGQYMDLFNSNHSDGTHIISFPDNGGHANQKWSLKYSNDSGTYTITSVEASNLSAGVGSQSLVSGAELLASTTGLQFYIESGKGDGSAPYKIKAKDTSLVLTVTISTSTNITFTSDDGSSHNLWNFEKL